MAMSEAQFDRLQDQQALVSISQGASDHWPPEIVKQLSYTIRRMNSVIKSSDQSGSIPTTSPEQGEQK
jgi:hypothetical protein